MSSHILAFKVIQLLDEKLKQTPAKVSKGGFTSLKHTHTQTTLSTHTHTKTISKRCSQSANLLRV
jgi:hypothetical protein